MKYCPFCAEKLIKPVKVCPYCKKSLDLELFQEIYVSGESSQVNRKLLLKRWFKERSLFFYPVITLLIGFIIGILLTYSYSQLRFAKEKSEYQNQIAQLQNVLQQKEASAGNVQSDLQNQLLNKDEIIKILLDQKDLFSRLIYTTNRLSINSSITLNTPEDIDNFKRNTLYLIQLFNEAQARLNTKGLNDNKTYTLQTVPALLE
jgi:uncharacterized membrane-anchored protein YhcB (DUF1043 family)